MNKLMIRIQNDIAQREERGAAMAEYGLLLALVALAAIVILSQFGDSISAVFSGAKTELDKGVAKANGGAGGEEGGEGGEEPPPAE